jgi:uncharacterized membrane protein
MAASILIWLVVWVTAKALTGVTSISLLFGLVFAIIYRQHVQIAQLAEQLARADLQRLSKATPNTATADRLAAQTGPEQPTTPPPPAAHSTPASRPAFTPDTITAPTPKPVFSTPSLPQHQTANRTAAGLLEDTVGPTLSDFLLRGNPIARIGVIILFFGVAFALKFAAEQGWFPIELRLLLSTAGAFALIGLGWSLRREKPQFSLTLEGAGAGVLYITVFIAFKMYELLPETAAFCFFILIASSTALFAIAQDARVLALLAVIGGFLAPLLTLEIRANHVLFFSYITLLNFSIFAICLRKSWRELTFFGSLLTFILGILWEARYYTPNLFASTEPFLLLFVLLYTAVAIIFALRASSKSTIDTVLTFGPPFFGTLLQYQLVANFQYGLAYSAAGFGAFYLITSYLLGRRYRLELRFLIESYFALGIALLSLTVPFALSGRATAAVWSLEALALLWSGIRQKQWITRLGGEALLIFAALFFLSEPEVSPDARFIWNPFFLGITLLSVTSLWQASLIQNAEANAVDENDRWFGKVASFISILCWFLGAGFELIRNIDYCYQWLSETAPGAVSLLAPFRINIFSLFVSLSILAYWSIGEKLKIAYGVFLKHFYVPCQLAILVLLSANGLGSLAPSQVHPFGNLGFISWPIAFLAHYLILYTSEAKSGIRERPELHIMPLTVLTMALTWEAYWVMMTYLPEGEGWRYASLSAVPALVTLCVTAQATRSNRWPWAQNRQQYINSLNWHAVWIFVLPAILLFFSSGNAAPLPYIPLLNPLDIAQALTLAALLFWGRKTTDYLADSKMWLVVWLFLWSTSVPVRSVHHYADVAWNFKDLCSSPAVHSALSIFWSCLALALMWMSHKKSWRIAWQAGAALLGIVVAKLFIIDLASQGTAGRIFAFVSVGILMLIIGYLAPIPPSNKDQSH